MTIAPMMLLQGLARTFPLDWSVQRDHRLRTPGATLLGPYYIGWDSGNGAYGEGWDAAPRDANGVMLSPGGTIYDPTHIAQFGLEQHSRWVLRSDAEARRAFLAQARWLRDQQAVRGGIAGCYPFPFAWPAYGAPLGFLSAMTQGEAISLLLRAYETTGENGFLDAAARAAEPFRHEIRAGGVTWRSGDDVIFEEAAADPPAHILNGWIFALWGLHELHTYSAERDLVAIYEQSVRTLQRRLILYDSGSWSYYNLLATRRGFRKLATLKYHAFHIAQLRVMASLVGEACFNVTADRWSAYAESPMSRLHVYLNAAAGLIVRAVREDTVPRGARSVV
ncbi:MAG: hypothetical protein KGM44_03295 [bacterium]|nr:hypothetical protein [bacterium]